MRFSSGTVRTPRVTSLERMPISMMFCRVTLEPESEVCTVDQEATSVSRFSMTPIIASLAKPTAIMTRAS